MRKIATVCLAALAKHVLKNGLRVLLSEDHTSPTISYYSWFDVGSGHEKKGMTGIAHLFEHMMFQGTQKFGKKQYDKLIASHGGNNNAFTSNDYTAYYVNIESSELELLIKLEADRLTGLNITKENLDSEREVVKEERRLRTDNDPMGKMYEELFLLAFPEHPYGWPVIGFMQDVTGLSVDQCKDFYQTYYSPNNLTIALVGDFSVSKAIKLLEKYYSSAPSQVIPPREMPKISLEPSEKRKMIHDVTQSEMLMTVFQVPKVGTPESYAFSVLEKILSSGNTSRLYKRLIYEEEVATQVGAGYYGLKDAGLFLFYLIMKPGSSLKKGEKMLIEEIKDIIDKKVSDRELIKAKNNLSTSFAFGLKSRNTVARELGYNQLIYGDYRHFFSDLKKYESITAQDIQKAAEVFFVPNRKTTIVLLPQGNES
ncbi:MAG: insulinase family protein [Deltaproteobacteria bacterium]|nr:insulinase family protein [Deltaproteobacteria bacterium]